MDAASLRPEIGEDSSREKHLMDSVTDRKRELHFCDSRSCANKLGGGWEREKAQRAAKCYDDSGHIKVIGLRLLLLAAVIMTAKALSPQTNIRRMTRRLL